MFYEAELGEKVICGETDLSYVNARVPTRVFPTSRLHAFPHSREINIEIYKTVYLNNSCTRVIIHTYTYIRVL